MEGPPVGGNGTLGLACGGQSCCLFEVGVALCCAAEGFDLLDRGILRISFPKAAEVRLSFGGLALHAGGAGQAGNCVLLVGLDHKELLPGLGSEVNSSASLECTGFAD